MKPVDLAILAAFPDDVGPLWPSLRLTRGPRCRGKCFHTPRIPRSFAAHRDHGVGKVNAAALTAAILTRFGPIEVWNIGCAGAYAEGGLRHRDVLMTREHICGDEGDLAHRRQYLTRHIGIPLLTRNGLPFSTGFPPKLSKRAEWPKVLNLGRNVVNASSSPANRRLFNPGGKTPLPLNTDRV